MPWFAHGVKITVHPAVEGARNAKGNRAVTHPESAWYDVYDCGIAPRYSTESPDRASQGQVVVGQVLYGPYSLVLGPMDQIECQGHLYSVDGRTGSWANPHTGDEAGSETAIVEVINANGA